MSNLTISTVNLDAVIDADDIVRGLKNNDGHILPFIIEMLDRAGSSELEEELLLRLRERLGLTEQVPLSSLELCK